MPGQSVSFDLFFRRVNWIGNLPCDAALKHFGLLLPNALHFPEVCQLTCFVHLHVVFYNFI